MKSRSRVWQIWRIRLKSPCCLHPSVCRSNNKRHCLRTRLAAAVAFQFRGLWRIERRRWRRVRSSLQASLYHGREGWHQTGGCGSRQAAWRGKVAWKDRLRLGTLSQRGRLLHRRHCFSRILVSMSRWVLWHVMRLRLENACLTYYCSVACASHRTVSRSFSSSVVTSQ